MKPALARQTAICVAVFGLVIAGTAHAQTKINDCTTITEPGSYVVTKNIRATSTNLIPPPVGNELPSCILIAADFVTLDLAGFTIDGSNLTTFANGINAPAINGPSHKGIVVHSGTVANFPGTGVHLFGNGHTVHDIRAFNNSFVGIAVGGGVFEPNGHRIIGNTAISNGQEGIVVLCPAVVLENVASGNGSLDISAISGCLTGVQNSPAP